MGMNEWPQGESYRRIVGDTSYITIGPDVMKPEDQRLARAVAKILREKFGMDTLGGPTK